ncbi:MAG: M48 family metallopeptidase [Verrucomicrobiota bacterium]|nr:M48 family metallopeptidase [Verrucomicrobiota bacterium]
MDFFARQDQARRNTKLLVFYFALAVLCLTLAVYVAVALTLAGTEFQSSDGTMALSWWQPDLFFATALGNLAVISVGSIFKTLQLARGGSAVAELLDGRLINSSARDAHERKLLNVVEEMAIASGVPVPQVYVMDGEPGINAFAAGYSSGDAAISVTRGCMTLLSRDELQGVIGHEFSHILNGDMRLNLRLIGLIFGILCLTIIGRVLLQTRGKKNPLPLLGLALIVIGWGGVLFGRLIQAAVSRQREVLADASAVQFTRNPGGLAGALKKIGGLAAGSRLHSPHAEEASHLFFADGMGSSIVSFRTHPPLIERIRALDPAFDGKFPTVMIPDPADEVPSEPPAVPPPLPALPFPQIPLAGFVPAVVAQQEIVGEIGQPTNQHLRYAVDFQEAIPSSLQAATRDPLGACALVCAFLLDEEPAARERQIEELSGVAPESMREETIRIWPEAKRMPPHARIPLIDLALPALRRLSPPQFEEFRRAQETLMASDNETSLFEYMLQKIVTRHLETHFFPARRSVTQFYALAPLVADCGVLLSATAYCGHEDSTQAHAAFAQGAELLGRTARSDIPWLPPDHCDFSNLDRALERLSQAVPQIKKNLLSACAQTVAADGVIQEPEAELLRAIADALDCPVPPFVQPEQAPNT